MKSRHYLRYPLLALGAMIAWTAACYGIAWLVVPH